MTPSRSKWVGGAIARIRRRSAFAVSFLTTVGLLLCTVGAPFNHGG